MAPSPRSLAGRHLVLMQRTENRLRREIDTVLDTAQRKLIRLVQLRDPMAVSAGRRTARLASLQREADEVLTAAYQQINTLTRATLVEVSNAAARFGQQAVQAATAGVEAAASVAMLPTKSVIRATATQAHVQGDVMHRWWSAQRSATKAAFRRSVTQSVLSGESSGQLARRLRGTVNAAGRRVGGVLSASRREAHALARTAIAEVTTRAALATYAENDDVMSKVEFLATLDEATCALCGDLDGKVYNLTDVKLDAPPLHYNCRCTLLPVPDYAALGLPVPKEEKRQTYREWFAAQDAKTQDSIVGPGKATLVRSGEATFSDLVNKDRRILTLTELRAATRDLAP